MDSKLLHGMFFLGLPVAEKIARPLVVYAFLMVGLRLAGKRELAQLNPFDLVSCSRSRTRCRTRSSATTTV